MSSHIPVDPTLDSLTRKQLEEYNFLSQAMENLTSTAGECLAKRRILDAEAGKRYSMDLEHGGLFKENEECFEEIRRKARDLVQRRRLLKCVLPIMGDEALEMLEGILLMVERYKLCCLVASLRRVEMELDQVGVDLGDVRDGTTSGMLEDAVKGVGDAVGHLRNVFADVGLGRLEVVDEVLGGGFALESFEIRADLEALKIVRDSNLLSNSSSSSSSDADSLDGGEFGSEEDSEIAGDLKALRLGDSDLDSDSRSSSDEEDEGNNPFADSASRLYQEDKLFRFDSKNKPCLADIAEWLGLANVSEVAVLLNERAIQNAFSGYSAAVALSAKEDRFPLFMYAHQIVGYLESEACDVVDWVPVMKDLERMDLEVDDYEVARWRSAVALQILTFLENTLSWF